MHTIHAPDILHYKGGIGAIKGWIFNKGKVYSFVVLWTIIQIIAFAVGFKLYVSSDKYKESRQSLGASFIIARTSAFMIHVNTSMILFPVCRNIITSIRGTFLNNVIPFDLSIGFHKIIGWTIVFFSLLHTAAHYRNYYLLYILTGKAKSLPYMLVASGPSWSGHIMLVCLAFIAIPALSRYRRKNFNFFWYAHHLFSIFFFMFSIHGAFCMLKPVNPPYCVNGSTFYRYYVAGGVIYLFERILREIRGSRSSSGVISKVILHPSHVVEIRFSKSHADSCKAGQYVFINCPAVAINEWHPFTLTSAPEEDFYSVHIRVVGDWTKSFAKIVGIKDLDTDLKLSPNDPLDFVSNGKFGELSKQAGNNGSNRISKFLDIKSFSLPKLMIDGPFGSASEDVFKHEVAMLFGAGIGVTPFASILKSMWYRFNNLKAGNLKKVYFIWTQKDTNSFEWFQDLLEAIEEKDEENVIGSKSLINSSKSSSNSTSLSSISDFKFSNISLYEGSSSLTKNYRYPPTPTPSKFLDIRIYITAKFTMEQINNLIVQDSVGFKDTITNLRAPTIYGRPNLDKIFTEVATKHPGADVGVFFCGPVRMGLDIKKKSNEFTSNFKTRTRFTYNKENF
ncbi:Superoxide-generating NADPH oxidase heavy chain subunit A [Smittium mucronatum]|uniref:Superoxide-generating NADPH oxidase heavy chain subunit A n=1 Tax=Smittium mucronatum TaxID=133383 RepID=A0A1R0H2Q6_9FUNG|nr:Superoxide-generating NADPH oxidase heavy chain subunit A [Smittium mucronatum]